MTETLVAFLSLIAQIAPALGSTAAIDKIISTLISIIPTLVGTIQNLVPLVKNIIEGLQGNENITPEQWAALDKLNASADKDFEDIASLFDSAGNPIEPPSESPPAG